VLDSSQFLTIILSSTGLAIAIMFLLLWRQDRQREFGFRREQLRAEEERRAKQVEIEKEEKERTRWERYEERQSEEEKEIRRTAGAGTGGFIVLDLPDDQRPLFHDLLKGFEDYAKLKGYGVSFSIDATFQDRIAFKFTLHDGVFNVGQERVRSDFKEYLETLKDADSIDEVPVVVSLEEHELLVTLLKNRINFLQHSYKLEKNTTAYYETLMRKATNMPVFPSQQILLQTGGQIDSRNYSATNSQRLIQGNQNVLTDHSIDASVRIGNSFNERRAQIDALQRFLSLLRSDPQADKVADAIRPVERVKEELEEEERPNDTKISRWLARAKEALQLGSLGKETIDAAKDVFEKFGLP
jgi:hypothetical protein